MILSIVDILMILSIVDILMILSIVDILMILFIDHRINSVDLEEGKTLFLHFRGIFNL